MRKVFVCLLVLMMLAVTVSAQSSFIADELNLLPQTQRAQLNERLSAYHNDYGVSIALVTTDDLGGKSIETYAKNYYEQSGFTNDCAMLVICEAEGQWYIYTHGLCATIVTDENAARIGTAILDDLQAGDYSAAAETFVEMVATPVCEAVQTMNEEAQQHQRSLNKRVVIGLICGFAVGVAVAVMLGIAAKSDRLFGREKAVWLRKKPENKI